MSKKNNGKPFNISNLQDNETLKLSSTKESISSQEKQGLLEFAPLVKTIANYLYAKKKLPPTIDYNDLVSIGFDGLLNAMRNYKENKESQFKTYATIRIRGAILDLIRKEWSKKSPQNYSTFKDQIKNRITQVIDNEMNPENKKTNAVDLLSSLSTSYILSLDSETTYYADQITDTRTSFETALEHSDEYNELNKIVETLSKEEKLFIDLFYRKGIAQKEIAKHLNFSESKTCRIHQKLLAHLRIEIEKINP